MAFTQLEVAKALANPDPSALIPTLHEIAIAGEAVAAQMGYADIVARGIGHPDPKVAAAALAAVAAMGSIGQAYAGPIGDQLSHPSAAVRVAACQALGNMGEVAEDFSFKFASMVSDDSEACVKAAAITVLARVGGDAEVIKAALKNSDSVVAGAACEALGSLALISEADVTAKLKNASTTLSALKSLAAMGQKAYVSCLDEVVDKGLKSQDAACREAGVAIIGNLQEAALMEPTFGKIRDCSNSSVVGVKVACALALAAMGEAVAAMGDGAAGGPTTPLGALDGFFADANEDTSGFSAVVGNGTRRAMPRNRKPKCAAIYAVGKMRGLWSLQSKTVQGWLNDADWEVRFSTLEMLACFRKVNGRGKGDVTIKALSSMVAKLINDNAYPVRAKAIACLGMWGSAENCDNMVDALKDQSPDVREAAAIALSKLGDVAHDHCHAVYKLFNDKSAACRATAIKCLASMGEIGQNYAPVIATMMNEDDAGVQIAAIEALGSMGACGAAHCEDIGDHLYFGDDRVRSAAKLAMVKLGHVPTDGGASTQVPEDTPALYTSVLAAERARMGLKH